MGLSCFNISMLKAKEKSGLENKTKLPEISFVEEVF